MMNGTANPAGGGGSVPICFPVHCDSTMTLPFSGSPTKTTSRSPATPAIGVLICAYGKLRERTAPGSAARSVRQRRSDAAIGAQDLNVFACIFILAISGLLSSGTHGIQRSRLGGVQHKQRASGESVKHLRGREHEPATQRLD